MSNTKSQQSLENLGNALNRLEEALAISDPDQLMIDGTIQRFELTIELFWKTLKRLLSDAGIQANTPRESLKAAFKAGWLDNETAWLEMLNDRNQTAHVYDEKMALKIYQHIQKNFPEMKKVYTTLLL